MRYATTRRTHILHMHQHDSTHYARNNVSIDRGCDLVQGAMKPETVLEVAEEMKANPASHSKEVTKPTKLLLRGAAKKVMAMQEVVRELDPVGDSHEKRVFAYRPPVGSDKCFEFKKKHAKFISALNEHVLPKFGGSPGAPRPAPAGTAAQQAEDAYKEFLIGLDLVNQQEHINPEEIPLGKSAEELYQWERQIRGAGIVVQHRMYKRWNMHMSCLQIYKLALQP